MNINTSSVDAMVSGVEKLIEVSLNQLDESILPLLHQRLSHRLRGLSDNVSLVEDYFMDAEEQLTNLVEASLSNIQFSDVRQLANMVMDRHRLRALKIIPAALRRSKVPTEGEPSGAQVPGDTVDEQASGVTGLDGLLSTPSADITPTENDDTKETVQNAETGRAMGLDGEEFTPSDNEPKLDNNPIASKQKRRKLSPPKRKLSRSQSASAATGLPNDEPPILRTPRPRGRLSTEIFTASDSLIPYFNTPLSRQRPSPNLIAIAGMMTAVGELDRLSLMADAVPFGLFAKSANTPSGHPTPPPPTPVPPQPRAPGATLP